MNTARAQPDHEVETIDATRCLLNLRLTAQPRPHHEALSGNSFGNTDGQGDPYGVLTPNGGSWKNCQIAGEIWGGPLMWPICVLHGSWETFFLLWTSSYHQARQRSLPNDANSIGSFAQTQPVGPSVTGPRLLSSARG
jgi:hypothetical protein